MNSVLIPWVIATTILMFVAAYWIYTLEKRVAEFQERYEGLIKISEALSDTPDQAVLLPLTRRLDAHDGRLGTIESTQRTSLATLAHSIQGLGIVRYSAFDGVGGDQSFSVAMVDGQGFGAIITGLHSGEDVRVYAKPLQNWRSSYSLSADEQRALSDARNRMENGT